MSSAYLSAEQNSPGPVPTPVPRRNDDQRQSGQPIDCKVIRHSRPLHLARLTWSCARSCPSTCCPGSRAARPTFRFTGIDRRCSLCKDNSGAIAVGGRDGTGIDRRCSLCQDNSGAIAVCGRDGNITRLNLCVSDRYSIAVRGRNNNAARDGSASSNDSVSRIRANRLRSTARDGEGVIDSRSACSTRS